MIRRNTIVVGIVTVWLAVLGLVSFAQDTAQNKYTVSVPGGLAFSEFRGYETWQTISLSRNDTALAVILGNPVMIEAYKAGDPGWQSRIDADLRRINKIK